MRPRGALAIGRLTGHVEERIHAHFASVEVDHRRIRLERADEARRAGLQFEQVVVVADAERVARPADQERVEHQAVRADRERDAGELLGEVLAGPGAFEQAGHERLARPGLRVLGKLLRVDRLVGQQNGDERTVRCRVGDGHPVGQRYPCRADGGESLHRVTLSGSDNVAAAKPAHASIIERP